MAEYIDRAVAVSQANFIHGRWDDVYVSAATLMAIPAADVVPVTRCKDCRNHRELNRKDRLESGYAEGVLWCMNRSDGVWADGFCSDGEPKEN